MYPLFGNARYGVFYLKKYFRLNFEKTGQQEFDSQEWNPNPKPTRTPSQPNPAVKILKSTRHTKKENSVNLIQQNSGTD